MEKAWVDFKHVKAKVSMQLLLTHYALNGLRKSGKELRGRCPIHEGDGPDAFHVSLEKNAFHCFSCKAKGNVLDFVAAMEKCSLRDAALRLSEWFALSVKQANQTTVPEQAAPPPQSVSEVPLGNRPLTFELKAIDHQHPYLAQRGVTAEVAARFGLGYFAGRGSMSNRVVIPIHNDCGELVAYAGRAIDESEPRYKLPAGFHKSLELYNLHRAKGECGEEMRVVVVEGFFGCIRVASAGLACVALMGSSLSEAQASLLVRHFKAAQLMFDGNEAGQSCTSECLNQLGRRMWVKAVELKNGQQPDNFEADAIRHMLAQ